VSDVARRREDLYGLLGELPARSRPLAVEEVGRDERRGYLVDTLTLDLNGSEPVPAYFVRPRDASGPFPTVLYNHAHCADYVLGKDELLEGREILQKPPYATALTERGYAALCIDAWGFGQRRGRSEGEIFREMLWNGEVLWGSMVYDSLRAIDYLCTREDVASTRIATLGMSMGSTMAWWLAALDQRVKVCVDICCLTDFDALIATRALEGHGLYYYVPSLRKHFTTAQINALIAPRAHLSVAGIYDRLTPPEGLDRIDAELRQVYEAAGAPNRWQLSRHAVGHIETATMRAEILRFLESEL
jgi:pimeloyl-ACP methyl ester carboxylesterase